MSVPVTARSKLWFCGRSPAGTVGSNTAGGMDVCLSLVNVGCCKVEALWRADHYSRGVLPTVVCRCV
jgi:hypothetical protein